jgi:hypothetical protein
MRPPSVAMNTTLLPAALNIVRCASSCASSPSVRDNPSTAAPNRVNAAATSNSTANVRVVRSLSSSECS